MILPDPHPAHAVVSDGRIVPHRLGKASCCTCGLVSTPGTANAPDIRLHYGDGYDLNLVDSPAEQARARRYAGLIQHLAGGHVPGRVLEIGCGSGALLRMLAADWADTRFEGIEAAPALAALPSGDARIVKRQGFAEDLLPHPTGHQLVFSINVIEHALDPAEFLKALAAQTTADGHVVIICPSGTRPSLELVFADHIHTLTASAFAALTAQAGLAIARHEDRPEGFGDFQAFVLVPDSAASGEVHANPAHARAIAEDRSRYLAAWAELDRHFDARLGPAASVAMFGAGEAACLLRAYAPRTWQRVEQIWVDDPALARRLDRPVVAYAGIPPTPTRRVVVAMHPASQAAVASRLERDGHSVAIWSDLIQC